jgi:FKBP-type peptidyl-prolyl cis-trans isomerase
MPQILNLIKMKKITLTIIGALALVACDNGAEETTQITLTSNIDSVSYAIGSSQAKGMLGQIPELSVESFMAGYKDFADSATLLIAEEEAQGIIQVWSQKKQMEQMAQQQKEQEEMYGGAKLEGEKFMEENKTKEGVQVTASGIQYIVIKEGKGKQPIATSNVTVHYHGTTPDGTVFDSSVDRNEPATFALNQVIPGWTEGVALMKEGAKYKFFIPQELAYGANPRPGGPITPFMPLVFEIELIKVND